MAAERPCALFLLPPEEKAGTPVSPADGRSPHSPRAVLFDLDGTLLDSLPAHYNVYRKVFADLGLALPAVDYARRYSPNWYIFYERMGLPRERGNEADTLWLRHYENEAPDARPGADAILTAVRASGRRLGLVTSGDRSRVERDILRAGWETT